jgi:PAS domain S-box-containing protein
LDNNNEKKLNKKGGIPNIAVILTDKDKQIIWVNEDFSRITGYSLSDSLGRKPGDLLQGPKTEREVVVKMRRSLDSQSPLKEEVTNYRKNGEEYLCKLVIHPVFDRAHRLTNFIAFEVDGSEVGEDEIPLLDLGEKYKSSSLKGIEEVKLYARLQALMEKDDLFLDPNLTLKMVADMLATNTKYLSQVVNKQAGCNFQQFINSYRVEVAKNKISSDEFSNLTLYGIALQCGFKNKSTFYKVFKEFTSQTPREYLMARA